MSADVRAEMKMNVDQLAGRLNADVYAVTAGITDRCGNRFIEVVRGIKNKRENAILILTTQGGSADAAYQMARCVKKHYKKFTLFVFGHCKSAGTLIAVGADEIVMSEFGQLARWMFSLLTRKRFLAKPPHSTCRRLWRRYRIRR